MWLYFFLDVKGISFWLFNNTLYFGFDADDASSTFQISSGAKLFNKSLCLVKNYLYNMWLNIVSCNLLMSPGILNVSFWISKIWWAIIHLEHKVLISRDSFWFWIILSNKMLYNNSSKISFCTKFMYNLNSFNCF